MDETPLVAGGDASANDGWRRQIPVRRDRQFDVLDRLRDEDSVERHDDAVVVLDMRCEKTVLRDRSVKVIFEMRVRDGVAMTVRPIGLVHVLHRGEREARQTRDETQRDRAKCEHYSRMLRDRVAAPQLKSL